MSELNKEETPLKHLPDHATTGESDVHPSESSAMMAELKSPITSTHTGKSQSRRKSMIALIIDVGDDSGDDDDSDDSSAMSNTHPHRPRPLCPWGRIFILVWAIALVVIGAVFIDDCPGRPSIPVLLIADGAALMFKIIAIVLLEAAEMKMSKEAKYGLHSFEKRKAAVEMCYMIVYVVIGGAVLIAFFESLGAHVVCDDFVDTVVKIQCVFLTRLLIWIIFTFLQSFGICIADGKTTGVDATNNAAAAIEGGGSQDMRQTQSKTESVKKDKQVAQQISAKKDIHEGGKIELQQTKFLSTDQHSIITFQKGSKVDWKSGVHTVDSEVDSQQHRDVMKQLQADKQEHTAPSAAVRVMKVDAEAKQTAKKQRIPDGFDGNRRRHLNDDILYFSFRELRGEAIVVLYELAVMSVVLYMLVEFDIREVCPAEHSIPYLLVSVASVSLAKRLIQTLLFVLANRRISALRQMEHLQKEKKKSFPPKKADDELLTGLRRKHEAVLSINAVVTLGLVGGLALPVFELLSNGGGGGHSVGIPEEGVCKSFVFLFSLILVGLSLLASVITMVVSVCRAFRAPSKESISSKRGCWRGYTEMMDLFNSHIQNEWPAKRNIPED